MIVALLDNGSLEPAAHRNLRAVAAALTQRTGVSVRAVSWKHSDRITPELLDDTPAWTLAPFIRAMFALGQREFVFVPFFISAQGAIGSALRADLEKLQRELSLPPGSDLTAASATPTFDFTFTDGLAARDAIPTIVADRIRTTLAAARLVRPPVIVVDHGGPSATSASLRDELTAAIRDTLESEVGPIAAASMEGLHPPLLAGQLRAPAFAGRDILIAPLFLSPGRHAGPDGDIARICAAAKADTQTRCHLTDLVGTHPLAVDTLAAALRDTLSTLHAQPFA